MLLVLGGTTEGRKTIEVLEEGGAPFFYSTKTGEQEVTLHHGRSIAGAMDEKTMRAFCQEQGVRLIIDAAHPFARQLHHTVAQVAEQLQVPAIRFERIFPERDDSLTWIDDYSQVPRDIGSLLATTGVQSIGKLKSLEREGIRVFYRILPRESSIRLAPQQGATDEQLCFYEDGQTIDVEAEAILLKESGLSGGFQQKVEAAKARGMRVIVLKRPDTPAVFHCVNGPHGLRRMVERLLPLFFPLKSGLTTGTCATAAAVAATRRLLFGVTDPEVPVILPNGETIAVPVGYADGYAYVIKESGDDPDITNGLEIRATVQFEKNSEPSETKTKDAQQETKTEEAPLYKIEICGGEGIGRFTLPGFDYPPGEPAINKGPRQMLQQNIAALLKPSSFARLCRFAPQRTPPSLRSTKHLQLKSLNSQLSARLRRFALRRTLNSKNSQLSTLNLRITISAPQGETIAKRTFNPRLGIEGGISIIGVSGIVMPFSEEAFIESIRRCMQVAKASGADRVVINSGAKSERFVRARYPELPRQAFVEYGNYIGETLKMADELAIPQVTLGVMLGKAVKLAAGQLDTHSRKSVMDKPFLAKMLAEADCQIDLTTITLARELWQCLPPDRLKPFARVVIDHCARHCKPLLPNSILTILLIDDEGRIFE